jgi:hypothetical protein
MDWAYEEAVSNKNETINRLKLKLNLPNWFPDVDENPDYTVRQRLGQNKGKRRRTAGGFVLDKRFARALDRSS